MAFTNSGRRGGPVSDLNVTPMIDVLLVLLVISMLAVPLLRRHLDLQLPLTREMAPGTASRSIVLEVAADGTCSVNGQQVPRAALGGWLRQLYARRPDKLLFVKASGELEYQAVVSVFSDARAAGVEVLGLVAPD